MNKPNRKKLLSQDIDDRFKSEKKFVHDPDHQGNVRSRTIQLIFGILMTIVAVGGIIFGLMSLL